MNSSEYMSTTDVAEITGLSVDAVGARARRGTIASVKDEFGRVFVHVDEVRRLKAQLDGEDELDDSLGRDPLSVSKAILQEDKLESQAHAEIVRLRAENAEQKRVLRKLNQRESLNDRIVSEIHGFLEEYPYKPTINIPTPALDVHAAHGRGLEMLLAVSDAHYPEVVNPDEALGVAYGPEITRRRMEHLLDRTVRLVELREGLVEKVTVAVIGDMLGGNIHDELEVTNAMPIGEALTGMSYMLYEFAVGLKMYVPEVEMIIMPGNHARLTKKPRNKQKYDNYEFIMGQFVKGLLRDFEGITVTVPKDIIYTHKIYDWTVGVFHGDGSKAASFAGIPFYGIKQRSNAVQAMLSTLGFDRLNMLLMGHYHKMSLWTEGDCHIVINGAIKGGDEYSIVTRSSISPAVQALMTFHREHGWISTERIELEHIV